MNLTIGQTPTPVQMSLRSTNNSKISMSLSASSGIPIATESTVGGMMVGDGLKISEGGVLSVDTAVEVEQDNTKPITSAAVYTEVGNIEALLQAL